jgi:hypothetical protein
MFNLKYINSEYWNFSILALKLCLNVVFIRLLFVVYRVPNRAGVYLFGTYGSIKKGETGSFIDIYIYSL